MTYEETAFGQTIDRVLSEHAVPAPARPRPAKSVPRRNRQEAPRLRDRVTSHGRHDRRAITGRLCHNLRSQEPAAGR
jgi:hypothetical protein